MINLKERFLLKDITKKGPNNYKVVFSAESLKDGACPDVLGLLQMFSKGDKVDMSVDGWDPQRISERLRKIDESYG